MANSETGPDVRVQSDGKDGSSENTNAESELRRTVEETLNKHPSLRAVKKAVVGVIGGTVLLIGVLLLVLPGPAFLVIPAGLAILALEFRWAKRWLRKAKALISKQKSDSDSNETHEN
jgi:uncharacterized protein (TIGR02611 family)